MRELEKSILTRSGLSAKWLKRIFLIMNFIFISGLAALAADEWFDTRDYAAQNLQILSASTARAVDSYFSDRETELAYLGALLIDDNALADVDKAKKIISRFQQLHRDLDAVHLYLPDGKLYASSFFADGSHPEPQAQNCRIAGRLCVLPTSRSSFSPDGYEIPLLYPVENEGKVAFLIRMDLPESNQQFLWRNIPLSAGMHIILLREDGRLQSRFPSRSDVNFERQSGLFASLKKQAGPSGTFTGQSRHPQEKRFGAYKKLDRFPLTATVSIPAVALQQQWQASLYLPLFATMIILSLGAFGYHYLRINSERFELERVRAEKALHANAAKHAAILRTAMDGFLLVDADGRIIEVNDAYCAMAGYSREELTGMTLFELKFRKTRAQLNSLKRKIIDEGSAQFETVQIRRDGSRMALEVGVNYLPLEEGVFFAFIRDISGRKKAESLLHAEKELAHVTLESIGDAVITTDARGYVNYLNPVAENLTGWSNSDAQGIELPQVFRIVSENNREQLPNPVVKVLRNGKTIGLANHTILIRRDGVEFAIEDTAAPIRNRGNQIIGVVLVFHDVSDKRELMQRVTWQAGHDALTGLPNRVLLQDRIGHAMATSRRDGNLLAVLFMDLDGFKEINDTFGHAAGDMLLKEIANRLLTVLRAGDTVSRLGGDEFVMLIEVASREEIDLCLERISDAVRVPVFLEGKTVAVTPSIGFTIYPLNDSDADTLLRHADMAMYQAKQSGRNQYRIFDVKMDQLAKISMETRENVARALKGNELRLHYQPKIDMRSGKVTGVEALIRWQHPERGLLLPIEFLPFVEDTDLIADIGMWVIDEALGQLEKWGMDDLTVSVNTAARQLQSPEFLRELELTLSRHPQISPDRLELEILETTALEDLNLVQTVLTGCKKLGVQLSLDDFGTGYSSLSYLKYLPVDTLKIDQSFVRDMLDDREDLAIIEAVVSMAKIFGRTVIAEGMETAAHGTMLLRLGCEHAQGYGIARPMPCESILPWIANWQPDPQWLKWADREWLLQDFPLLTSRQAHELWKKDLIRAISGAPMPPLEECRFLRWTQGTGKQRFGECVEFSEAVAAHRELHRLGDEILSLASSGQSATARALLPTLSSLEERFNEKLAILQEKAIPEPPRFKAF